MNIKNFIEKLNTTFLEDLINEDEINFKYYIPIIEKDEIVKRILNHCETLKELDDTMSEDLFIPKDYNLVHDYEVMKTLSIVGAYFDFPVVDTSDKYYDTIIEKGVLSFLDKTTIGDYSRFMEYCDKATGINLYSIFDKITLLMNRMPTAQGLKEFEETMKDIDPDTIKKMDEILKYNNSLNGTIVQNIEKIDKT